MAVLSRNKDPQKEDCSETTAPQDGAAQTAQVKALHLQAAHTAWAIGISCRPVLRGGDRHGGRRQLDTWSLLINLSPIRELQASEGLCSNNNKPEEDSTLRTCTADFSSPNVHVPPDVNTCAHTHAPLFLNTEGRSME